MILRTVSPSLLLVLLGCAQSSQVHPQAPSKAFDSTGSRIGLQDKSTPEEFTRIHLAVPEFVEESFPIQTWRSDASRTPPQRTIEKQSWFTSFKTFRPEISGDFASVLTSPSLREQAELKKPQQPAAVDGKSFSDDQWHFTVAPYGWLPTIKAWIAGESVTIHKGELLDDLDFTYMGILEARHKRWGLMLDIVYFRLDDKTSPVPGLSTKVKLKESLYQLQGYYRFGEKDQFLDLTAGVRWVAVSAALRLNGVTQARTRLDWFEPVVGLRFQQELGEKWSFGTRADIGGFSVGEAARLTYQGLFTMDYSMSESVSFAFGYRYIFIDHDGKANFKERVAGPIGGVVFRF